MQTKRSKTVTISDGTTMALSQLAFYATEYARIQGAKGGRPRKLTACPSCAEPLSVAAARGACPGCGKSAAQRAIVAEAKQIAREAEHVARECSRATTRKRETRKGLPAFHLDAILLRSYAAACNLDEDALRNSIMGDWLGRKQFKQWLRDHLELALERNRIAYNDRDVAALIAYATSTRTCAEWDAMTDAAQGAWKAITGRDAHIRLAVSEVL